MDFSNWQSDKNGCNGDRLEYLEDLRIKKEEFKKMGSEEIDRILGAPDSKDLDKRNRLYYRFDMSGSDKCDSTIQKKIYLQIRFNAINRADELIIFE